MADLPISGLVDGNPLQTDDTGVVVRSPGGAGSNRRVTFERILATAANGGVTIQDAATSVGGLLTLEDGGGVDKLLFDVAEDASRGGIRHLPVDYTQTLAAEVTYALQWDSTVTTNIPAGGGIGNDTAPAMVGSIGTIIFLDQGNLFSSSLLFNQGTQIDCRANIGPVYTLVNQPRISAGIAGAFTCSQHNALRIQPNWGGSNVAGGTITQTNATLIFITSTVDATVGTASVTTWSGVHIFSPTLTGGGTIGTWTGFTLEDITGPTTIVGFQSNMNSGTFINHDGTAAVNLGGALQFSAGAGAVDVSLSRGAANRLDLASGDTLRLIAGTLQLIDATAGLSVATAGEMNLVADRIGFNVAPAGSENYMTISAPARTASAGGTDIVNCLNSSGGAITLTAAYTNGAQWTVNAPTFVDGGGGSLVNAANMIIQTSVAFGTNRYGLLITANPSGGTLNYALRVLNGDARFDARVDIDNPIALGGGATATLGTIGGSGPTVAAQAQWLEIDIGGTAHWIPVWT